MKVEGACHCGAIAFEAQIDPQTVTLCHCADCQTLSGAPFRASVPVRGENLNFTRGTPRIYIKVAESGNKRAQGFCVECGTPLFSTSDEARPEFYMVRVGCIKERGQLVPKRQIWAKSAQPWSAHIAGLESYERGAPMPGKT